MRELAETPVSEVSWQQFERIFAKNHKQGEHVSIVGPTGSGKTVVMLSLCKIIAKRKTRNNRPASVVVLPTKPQDETVTSMVGDWPIVKKWPPAYGQEHCIVWPRPGGDVDTIAKRQRAVIRPLLNAIYHEGGQTVGIDEAGYFEDPLPDGLGLSTKMKHFWTSARSLQLTLIAGTQRPRFVTRSMWSEPSWVFIFKPEDEDDLLRVAQLSGARREVMELAGDLDGHEFLCVRRKRGEGVRKLYISKVE